MGRFYYGDIEGKFCVADQNSDDANQFGARESDVINYYVDVDDFDSRQLDALWQEWKPDTPTPDTADDIYFALDEKGIYCFNGGSLRLGLEIKVALIENNGVCTFAAET